ncbi:MAG TPA: preprotein translocase subunit SecE [Gallionellaceae bacterium]|nr:preprotein translocase subunit SecE [Gallionellaceae bacterium]
MVNIIKIGVAFLLVVAGIAGYYFLQGSAVAFAEVLRVLSVLLGLVLAAAVLWTSEPGKRFFGFGKESVAEARRVVWPTRKETLQTTGVVVLFAVVMALFLWAVDATLLFAINKLMGRG